MAGQNTLQFDDDNFEAEVLQSEVPVLVDFWAEWCGPCLMLAPIIDEIAEEMQGKVKVGKVNVDQSPQVAAKFGIQNIPTIIVFDKGQDVEKVIGVRQKQEYVALLNAKLGAG